MNTRIAGHEFVDGPNGRECSMCGKKWLAVLGDREFWRVGEMNIAHSGSLNQAECDELNAELSRIWSAVTEDARA